MLRRLTFLLFAWAWPLVGASEALLDSSFRAYVDARVVAGDDVRGWQERGFGRTRYGARSQGDSRFEPRLAEAMLLFRARLGWSMEAVVDVKFDDAQDHLLDISEAFVRWTSSPEKQLRFGAKIGTFFPPVSLEHRAVGWTSPYLISASAINTWIGEEIRINGGEFKLELRRATWKALLRGAAFFANDTAGTLISWRGWAIHDRKLGLFDDAPLPEPAWKARRLRGPFGQQAPSFEPLHEVDGRVGFYIGMQVGNDWLRFELLYYDNNGDPEALDRSEGQFAWDTRFVNTGVALELPGDVTVLAQYMDGATNMGGRFPPIGRRAAEVDYRAAYLLVSRRFGRHRLSARYDYFETIDRDTMEGVYDNNEHGDALALAWIFKPTLEQRISVEGLYVKTDREALSRYGLSDRFDELEIQFSYRRFF
jgi:hypothetical protein